MRQDLKGLPMEKAKPVFKQFFSDEYAHELEVEELEIAFNRATKATLGDLYCFRGHYSEVEDLLAMGDDDESIVQRCLSAHLGHRTCESSNR